MAGASNALEDDILDWVFNTTYATCYIQFHTADPGDDGTANVATETDRTAVTFGAASGGSIASDAVIDLTNVAASEDYTHFSLWSASAAGTCIWTGTVTADPVVAGNNFTIASGDLVITLD